MKLEDRPTLCLTALTDEELTRYASMFAETTLEEELLARMNYTADEISNYDGITEILKEMEVAGKELREEIVAALLSANVDNILSRRIYSALHTYENRVKP